MNLKEIFEIMAPVDLTWAGGTIIIILMTIVQIAPVKLNPWDKVCNSQLVGSFVRNNNRL